MAFATDIGPAMDAIRSIPGDMGLRVHAVTVRTRTWSGARVGVGTKTDVDVALLTAASANPKVRRVSTREIVASAGAFRDGDLKVGPMTPTQFAVATLDPATSSSPTELYYLVTGPDMSASGQWCEKVELQADHPLHRYLVLRPRALAP